MKKQENSFIKSFGITQMQYKLYTLGLQLGTCTVSRIARKMGIHRASAHTMLKQLCLQGLCSESKQKNMAYYTMVHPDVLESKIEEQVLSFRSIKPLLEECMTQEGTGMKVKTYSGFEGICSLYRQRLKYGGDAKVFLGVDHIDPQVKKWLYEVHMPNRVGKDFFTQAIVSQTDANSYYADPTKVPNTDVLVIPDGQFDLQCEMILTNKEHIFIASLMSSELGGIHIQSSYLHNSREQIFDLIRRFYGDEKS